MRTGSVAGNLAVLFPALPTYPGEVSVVINIVASGVGGAEAKLEGFECFALASRATGLR